LWTGEKMSVLVRAAVATSEVFWGAKKAPGLGARL